MEKFKTYFYPNQTGCRYSTFTGSEEKRIELGCTMEATPDLINGLKNKTLKWENGQLVSNVNA